MTEDLKELIEKEIEELAQARAAEIIEKMKSGKPDLPTAVTPMGKVITPWMFDGVMYLSRPQVEELLDVTYNRLWQYNKKGILRYHKVGGRITYKYDDVRQLMLERKKS